MSGAGSTPAPVSNLTIWIMMTKKQKSDILRQRVRNAKEILSMKGAESAKVKFFDKCYGSLFKSESIRLDNLWATYTTEEEFTELLEDFAKHYTNVETE